MREKHNGGSFTIHIDKNERFGIKSKSLNELELQENSLIHQLKLVKLEIDRQYKEP